MLKVIFIPFDAEHLSDAAALLARRHQRNRERLGWLPGRYVQRTEAYDTLKALWERPGASGVCAMREGTLEGFLLGHVTIDEMRGRTVWIHYAAHAALDPHSAELYRDMYAAASPAWLALGCFTHIVQLPACDAPLVDAWFRLSFGLEQVHGVLPLAEVVRERAKPEGIVIRQAAPSDRDALADMSDLIWRHQLAAPVWVPALPEYIRDVRKGYAGLVDDPDAIVWLAEDEGQIAGFQAYFPAAQSNGRLFVPDNCVELAVAATRTELRGRGIGRVLTEHGLAAAQLQGYDYCLTDWRATNLASSRFWPKLGFHPTMYRLVRCVDAQVVWANGKC